MLALLPTPILRRPDFLLFHALMVHVSESCVLFNKAPGRSLRPFANTLGAGLGAAREEGMVPNFL
jgi:hypothetical protein